MRNIFDQYEAIENRLTHALVCALAEDKRLLKRFVLWVTGTKPPNSLAIVEQRLAGGPEFNEGEAGRRGLPDAWIYGDDWSLIIENKVSSPLDKGQLDRHYETALRRGFKDVTILAIDVFSHEKKLEKHILFRKWSEIYSWLYEESAPWALKTARYMEILESRSLTDGYLKEGTLTEFSGIPFDKNNPYDYREAKRILKLAMDSLRENNDLVNQVKMNPKVKGRKKISKGLNSVWDYLALGQHQNSDDPIKHPHLTLSIRGYELVASLVISNQANIYRKNIVSLGKGAFTNLIKKILDGFTPVLEKSIGAKPWIEVKQRHFTTRSFSIDDAVLELDLRTAFDNKSNQVKVQPQWLDPVFNILETKKGNMQFAIGVKFSYDQCELKSKKILNDITNTWLACLPMIQVTFGNGF